MKLNSLEIQSLKERMSVNGVSKCTHCGYVGELSLSPYKFTLPVIDNSNLGALKLTDLSGAEIAAAYCPKCGHIEFFGLSAPSHRE